MLQEPSPTKLTTPVYDALTASGLARQELEAYEFLLGARRATPTQVANATHQSRGRVYQTLRDLTEDGLARVEAGRPVHYVPVELQEVLRIARAETEHRADVLRQALESNVAQAPLTAAPVTTKASHFGLVEGRRGFSTELHRMTLSGGAYLYVGGGGRMAERLAGCQSLLVDIAASARAGLDFQLWLPEPADEGRAEADIARVIGPDRVRFFPRSESLPVLIAVNESAAVVGVAQPDDTSPTKGQDIAVRIESPAIVALARRRFAALNQARQDAGAVHQDTETEEMLRLALAFADAKEEILGMGPAELTPLVLPASQAFRELCRRAKNRGVRLQALTDAAHELDGTALPEGWELRAASTVPSWVAIIDRHTMFQAFPPASGSGRPHVRRSENPKEISHYVDVFQRTWQQAPVPSTKSRN